MKKLLFALLVIFAHLSEAQNYQCLQPGNKRYFINANGYLRGMRIDSVRSQGDTTVYYPFHTPRGAYNPGTSFSVSSLDSTGGSWLGKRVLQLNDGTFIFDSYWNDSVIIKTQAHTGDSWVFYHDTSSLYYKATMLGPDTLTVSGSPDSVKTILITAWNSLGIVPSDPVNSFKILLSKNNGFVQIMDLYTFPYHKPDSSYRPGLDFFLDRSLSLPSNINYGMGLSGPAPGYSLFKLTDFINPNEQQLHNWDTGDVIISDNELGIPIFGTVTYTYLRDTISDRSVSGHYVNYSVAGSTFSCPTPPYYPCSLICKAGTYSFADNVYPITDTGAIPEDFYYHGQYLFYYPYDTSFCAPSAAYTTVLPHYAVGLGWVNEIATYKLGIGEVYFGHQDGDPTYETDRLFYYSINGVSCGSPGTLNLSSPRELKSSVEVYPNPASENFTIKSNFSSSYTITIRNMLGQTILTRQATQPEETIDVKRLPDGIYSVILNGNTNAKYYSKIFIAH